MKTLIAFDPGDSTGWVVRDSNGLLYGGTCSKNHVEVADRLLSCGPDTIVIMERFNLYPSKAQSLAWNSFYPCEVIGVIRYLCMLHNLPLVEQAPGIKKFAGGFRSDWDALKDISKGVTEHTKDAYLHYRYFLLNGAKKFPGVL